MGSWAERHGLQRQTFLILWSEQRKQALRLFANWKIVMRRLMQPERCWMSHFQKKENFGCHWGNPKDWTQNSVAVRTGTDQLSWTLWSILSGEGQIRTPPVTPTFVFAFVCFSLAVMLQLLWWNSHHITVQFVFNKWKMLAPSFLCLVFALVFDVIVAALLFYFSFWCC